MENVFSDLSDREKWCLEKVDFITSVVKNINREFVWAKIAACHSDKDVSKLLQRLLKDNGDSDENHDSEDKYNRHRGSRRVSDHSYDYRNDTLQVKRYDSHKAYHHENNDYNRRRGNQRVSDHSYNNHNDTCQVKRHDRNKEYRHENNDSDNEYNRCKGNRRVSDSRQVKKQDSYTEYRYENEDSDDEYNRCRGDQRVKDHHYEYQSNSRQVKGCDTYNEYRREKDDSDNEYSHQRGNRRVSDCYSETHQVTTNGNYKENRHDGNYDDYNDYQGYGKSSSYHEHNHDDETYSIDVNGAYGAVGFESRPSYFGQNTLHQDPEEDEDDIAVKIFNQVTSLFDIFPDADPDYLQKRCWKAKGDPKAYTRLVEELLQQKNLPRGSNEENFPEKFVEHPTVQYNSTGLEEDEEEDTVDDQDKECGICYDDVAAKDMVACNAKRNKHSFCRNCVKKFVEEEIGQGRSTFRCLELECKGKISNAKLKDLMSDKVFERVMTQQQHEEIESAGIDDLLSCPFCDFMMILPDKKDIVFLCQNPECGKDSCRFCKEPNHCPQTCEEAKADKQKDARTMLENRMAEAMIRECFKCKKRFIKEAGCNMMTCSCGAKMCYQCKQTISGYDHFHAGAGGCVLHAEAKDIHVREVRKAAEDAKKELDPNLELVHDPTKGIQ